MKKAIRGEGSFRSYEEMKLMSELGCSYNQLMDTPYEKYLDFRRLLNLEKKEEKKEQERQTDQVK